MRLSLLALCAAALAASPAQAAIVNASTAWPATCPLPYQGVFQSGVVHNIDCAVSTAIFPGLSAQPLQMTYGTKNYCYFIDNSKSNTFFLPLKTEVEWLSFYHRFTTDPTGGITIVECDSGCSSDKPIISFVIDESGSIGSSNYAKVKSFFGNLIDALDYTGTEPSDAVFFSTGVNKVTTFKSLSAATSAALKANYAEEQTAKGGKSETEKKAIADAKKAERKAIRAAGGDVPTKADVMSDAWSSGNTAIGDALKTAVTNLNGVSATGIDGKPLDKMIVLFTDGYSNTGSSVASAASVIEANGIKTFVIGVGSGVNTSQVMAVANAGLGKDQASGSNYRQLDSFKDMDTAFDGIAKSVCTLTRKH